MEFFIKQNSTLPLLKLQVVKDGRSDYNNFMKTIELSAIFFSMVDIETGIPKISSRPAGFVEKKFEDPNAEPEYYIYYQFSNKETNRVGRFEGQFLMRNDDGVIILPIRESLYINIQESFIAHDLPYESCYVSEFPCCISGPVHPTTTTTTIPVTTTTTTTTPVITTTTTLPVTTTTTTSPIVTTTTTLPVTTTTTTSPLPMFTTMLMTFVSSGSVIIDYHIILPEVLDNVYNCTICKSFNVVSGDPLIVEGSISIPSGEISGTTQIIIDDDWERIAEGSEIISFVQRSDDSQFLFDYENIPENYNFTPKPNPNVTPTPTPTSSVTPTPTPTSSVTPTPSITPTNTSSPTYVPSSTPTPSLTSTPIYSGNTVYYGKLEKLFIDFSDVSLLENLITSNIKNTYLSYEMLPGFCYLVVPETMSQPTTFKNSVDGCNGFTIPFAKLDNITIVDLYGNNIIYNVYRSFVSTSSNVDVWVCN